MATLRPLKEAAEMFGLHEQTVRYYLRRGYLTKHPFKPLDRRRHIDIDELRELLKNRPEQQRTEDKP
jgi:Helix-turn-helix domain